MTHSADWKVSTGAEGSVSSGADGAVSLLSSSSEGALAAPFIEPAIIQFKVLLKLAEQEWDYEKPTTITDDTINYLQLPPSWFLQSPLLVQGQ